MTKSIVSNLFKTLAFGLVLVAIALAFAACGDKDPKVEGFSVYLDGELVSDSNKTITLDYNNTANWEEKITVKLNYSDDTQKVITKGNDGYTITGIPTTLDAGTYELTIKYGTYNGVVVNLVINKVSIDMAEVEWSETTSFNYDGQEKKVELTNLPQGVTATYEGNTGTNAGDYTATATLVYDKKNYELTNNTIQLTKEWSIEKAIISMGNVSWNIKENFTYDGQEKTVELINLPEGVTATYTNNKQTNAGTYTAKATLVYDKENYILKNYDVADLIWIINPSEDYQVNVTTDVQYFVDALPTLSVSGFEGEVTWDVDQVKVFGESTAYSWTFTPNDENYATKTGTINLTQVSGYNQTFDYNVNSDWVDNKAYIYKDCTFETAISSTKKVDLTFDGCTFTTGNTGGGGDKCIYLTSFTNLIVNGCTFGGETTEGTMSTAGYALDLNIYSTTVDRIEITNNNFNTTKGENAESIAISIKVRLGETDKPTDVTGTIGSIENGVLISGNTFANTCDTIYIGSGPKGSTNANVSTGAFDVEVSNNASVVKVLERYLYAEGVTVPEQVVQANDTQMFGNKVNWGVNASIAKVPGITVTVDPMTTKKLFSLDNGDSEARVNQFAKYGELDQITINVSGEVSRADCIENAQPRDSQGNAIEGDAVVNYYTDFFQFKLRLPENATKLGVSDGLPAKPVAEIENIENGYLIENVQWLLGGADQTNWSICGNATTNDGYFYYAFYNDEDELVAQYFVRVVYDVTFVD